MGYILCTTEKPSVAKDIAHVLGADTLGNGYYEGTYKGRLYRVTWAVGHLVGLAPPENYGFMSLEQLWDKDNPDNRQKALAELPLIPEKFELVVLEGTKAQFNIMRKLMNDDECDYIIDCGDAGPEGHILQWFIRMKAGCRKEVKRFMATSMTDEAIREAFDNLEDVKKYYPVIKGEYCKKKADWILGMSMSRAASIVYDAKIDVGRVLSPTLYFVVKRYLDVVNFKSIDYYTYTAHMEGFDVYWNKNTDGYFKAENGAVDEENRLVNKEIAERTLSDLNNSDKATVTHFETKKRATDRPQLYDIIALERDGIRIFGYTADEVLTIAQSLYEVHKITTYPRTDSRYITSDLVPYMEGKVQDISGIDEYRDVATGLLKAGLNIDKKIVDDEKVTDHHAIITTSRLKDYDLSALSAKERNILDLIITRMLVSLSGKYKYKETVVELTFDNGMLFRSVGKIPVDYGWKNTQSVLLGKQTDDSDADEKEQLFPDLQLNQVVTLDKVELVSKKTSPPKLHTEDTLLTAMQNAGNGIAGGEIIKGRGIGTQSTRATIIKNLFDKKYVTTEQKGKTKYLVPTKSGMSVIKVLPPDLYSPKITADWENQIADIVEGNSSDVAFMDDFNKFISDKVQTVINNKIDNVDFSLEKSSFGVCPWCGNSLYKGELVDSKTGNKFQNIYCCNKECKFSIRKDNLVFKARTGKSLSDAQVKKLVTDKKLEYTGVSKSGNKYKGLMLLKKNDSGYVTFEFTFPPKSTAKKKGRSIL